MERAESYGSWGAIARLVASCAVLVVVVSVIAWAFRAPLERFGHLFIDRFGVAGMVGGAFLADGIHFPVPPQFYLLTGIAAGHGPVGVVLAVLVGSVLGGLVAFVLGRVASRSAFVARRIEGPGRLLRGLVERRGYLGLAFAMLLPVSYCLLCVAGGAMKLPYRAYGVLALMRVPRILLSYAVIAVAWQ